jgi:hypothetical protein
MIFLMMNINRKNIFALVSQRQLDSDYPQRRSDGITTAGELIFKIITTIFKLIARF